jgi:HK97 family phage major capsid protein
LVNHNADDQVGVVESARIDGDKTGRAGVRFGKSQRAQEIFEDVVSGIRKGISVGYYILKSKLEQRDGVETVLATLWEPLEISVASIAADWKGSGVGRSIESTTQRKELNTMSENTEIKNEEPKIDIGAEVEKRTAESVKRSKDILTLGAQYDCIEDASAFVNDGKTSGEFSRWILENKRKVEPVQQSAVLEDKKDRENFSISRAVRNFIDNGKWTGYEAEVSQTAQKAQGRATAGLCIPTSAFAKRDVTTATSGSFGYGGNTVSTDLSGFIDLLRNEAVALQAGATVMDGLTGNVAIPRLAGGATAYWLAEQGAVTEAVPTFDQVTLSPKRLAMHVNISKQLIAQSSVDVENILRNDLVATAANAIDTAVFTGTKYPTTGASDQPKGLYETIKDDLAANDVDFGAAPTYAEIVSLERLVADQNALRGNLAYVTSPLGAYTAKTVVLDSGSGRFLFEDGKMNSYPTFISSNVSITMDDPTSGATETADTAYYFGNWSDCLVGNWGGLDVVIDPYTLATTGTIRMIVTMYTDIDFRHVGSFAVGYLGSA